METKANLNGHPIHPMIVAFPITFYTVSLIAFAVFNWVNKDPFWYRLGHFCTLAGIAMAILAAIPGLLDWSVIPKNTSARVRGLLHASLNVAALLIFAVSALIQRGSWDQVPDKVGAPFWLSLVGVILTMAAGYQGWEMIATHKMGVHLTAEQERLEPAEPAPTIPFRPRPV